MMNRSDQRSGQGALRRAPWNPRALRGSESRFARRPLPIGLDVVLGEIDR
jgi:hypothetical protein